MTEGPISPKITADQAVADMISLGYALHRFAFPPSDLGLTRPLRPQEAERLKSEIAELHKRVEAASAYKTNTHLRSALEVVRDQIPDPMLVRVIAYVSWYAMACEPMGSSVTKATRAASLGNIEDMLRARYIIRRLITKGDTLVFKDGGFHGGDILPGGKINRLLTGDNCLSAIWTEETLKVERDQAERNAKAVSKNCPPPADPQPVPADTCNQSPLSLKTTSPRAIFDSLRQTVIGMDPVVRRFSIQMALHLKRVAQGQSDKQTTPPVCCLLAGPSGAGKTFLAEEFGKISGLPFAIGNMAEVSATAYVGASIDELFLGFAKKGLKLSDAERGILFLDEIDKKRTNQRGGDFDAVGSGVQYELLRLLEGSRIQIGGKRSNDASRGFIQTNLMAFILAGAFSGLSDVIKGKGRSASSIGFSNKGNASHLPPDVRKGLLEFFIPEMVNRIGAVIIVPTPSLAQLVAIATATNGIVAKQNQFLSAFGLTIKPSDQAISEVAAWALETKTFARGIRQMLQAVVEEAIFQERQGELAIGLEDVQKAIAGLRAEPQGLA